MRSSTKYMIPIILAIVVLPFLGSGAAQAQVLAQTQGPIHAEVDREALSTGESLLLTVSVNADLILSAPKPQLPDLPGFNLLSSSTSSQISIINGEITSQVVYHYQLQPYEAGDLVIGPVQVTISGQSYGTQPIAVHVTQGSGAPAPDPSKGQPANASVDLTNQDLFVEAEVDEPMPYVGQQVAYTFRLYQAVELWDQPQYDSPDFTGFWREPESDQQEYQIQAAGRIYRVTELRTLLFPSVLGPVTIEPGRFTIPAGFFRSGQTLQTKPVDLDVQPLPPGAPAGFSGAVGQFTLAAAVDTAEGKVDEPLTWQVTLSGQGNLNTAPDPAWPELDGWRSFESQASVHTEVREGQLAGSRVYERLLVPSAAGDYTLPPLEYVYFDPVAGQYQTARTEPIPVSIAPGDAATTPAPQPAAGNPPSADSKAALEPLTSDIRHLKPVPPRLGSDSKLVTASGLYWAAWAFPVLAVAGYFVWQRRQRYWENNLALARSSQASRKARKALSQARRQGKDAYAAAGHILTDYLSDKLGRPMTGLTHQALSELLAAQGVEASLVERVGELLVTGELGRFAPGADQPGYAESLLQEVDSLIAALEKVLQSLKRGL